MCTCSVSSSIEWSPPDRRRAPARPATCPVVRTSANAVETSVSASSWSIGPATADHHRAGVVVRLEEADARRSGVIACTVSTLAGRLAPERMIGEQLRAEHAVGDVVGRVVVHRQLFEDHLALAVDVGVAQRRPGQHVAEQLDAERGVAGRQAACSTRCTPWR